MSAAALLSRLAGVKKTGAGRWLARCPAHEDKSPSLSIRECDDGRILLHDFAGCDVHSVLSAVNLTFDDLFPEKPIGNHLLKGERRPFYAGDVLKIISFEAGIAYLCAADIANDKTLTESEQARLLLAVSRLNHAVEVANGY